MIKQTALYRVIPVKMSALHEEYVQIHQQPTI